MILFDVKYSAAARSFFVFAANFQISKNGIPFDCMPSTPSQNDCKSFCLSPATVRCLTLSPCRSNRRRRKTLFIRFLGKESRIDTPQERRRGFSAYWGVRALKPVRLTRRLFRLLSAASLAAPVVELVDAIDSKSIIGNDVGVQVPPGAPFSV